MDFISLVSVLVPYKDYPAKQRFGLLADREIRQARGLGNWFERENPVGRLATIL